MGRLRDYVVDRCEADPGAAVRFVNRSVRLVQIGRHWWDGRRKITDGSVKVGDHEVGTDAVTKPAWKLVPNELRAQFQAFAAAVDEAVARACVTSVVVGGEARPLVFGSGVYAVDVALWPRLRDQLRVVQEQWGVAADHWCSADGYKQLHAALARQTKPEDYALLRALVPGPDELRGRFRLAVTPLPFRLVEEVADPGEASARAAFLADLIEASVQVPREEAAAAWRGLAAQIVAPTAAGGLEAVRPVRTNADGTKTPVGRKLRGPSIVAAAKATGALDRGARFHDPDLRAELLAVRAELSTDDAVASQLAVALNGDDAAAVRVGAVLLGAAAVAVDEARMCAGVGLALSGSA